MWKIEISFYFFIQGINGESGPPGTQGSQGLKVSGNLVIKATEEKNT